MNDFNEAYYAAESQVRDEMAAQGWDFGCEDYANRDSILEAGTSLKLAGDLTPIPAPRDYNDEAARAVATYKSDAEPGYALHVESVDSGNYRPYSRKG